MGRGAEGFEGTGDHGIHGNGLGDKGRRGAPFLEKVSETGPQSAGLPGARSTPGDPAFQLMGNRRETSTGTLFLRVTPAVPASGDHRALPAASVAPGTGGGGGSLGTGGSLGLCVSVGPRRRAGTAGGLRRLVRPCNYVSTRAVPRGSLQLRSPAPAGLSLSRPQKTTADGDVRAGALRGARRLPRLWAPLSPSGPRPTWPSVTRRAQGGFSCKSY